MSAMFVWTMDIIVWMSAMFVLMSALFVWMSALFSMTTIASIDFSSFEGCRAKKGGAIAVVGGTLELIGTTVTNNVADEMGGAFFVSAGTVVQIEPFIAHLRADTYPDPRRFDPTRFLHDEQDDGQPQQQQPRLGFAGPARGSPGAELAVTLAEATFVQMRRMFDLRLGRDPPLVPAGYPLLSIPEGCKVLAEARMYYELKRENKKLRF